MHWCFCLIILLHFWTGIMKFLPVVCVSLKLRKTIVVKFSSRSFDVRDFQYIDYRYLILSVTKEFLRSVCEIQLNIVGIINYSLKRKIK